MSKSIDPINASSLISDLAGASKTNQNAGAGFSDVLSGALKVQSAQSSLPGFDGLGGLNMLQGLYMPQIIEGMEDSAFTGANAGEMSGAQLMLFMLIMMMQTGDSGGGDLTPIMQMMTQMLSKSVNEVKPTDLQMDLQNDMLPSSYTGNPGVKRMVEAALSQVGTQERNRDGSIGSGNYTKYGAWYGMDGQPWCAMFVSWSAEQAGLLNSVVPKHASTSMGVKAYKDKGLYEPRNSGYIPQEGDAIYFTRASTGQIGHVGIVVAYDPVAKKVYTVEGNTNNAVRIRHYDINDPRIHGYGKNGGVGYGRIPGASTSGNGANTI